MANMAQGAADNRSLHELAVDIAQDIGLLATGLAHVGAPPQITHQIEQGATLYVGVAKALAAGPVGAQTVGGQPGQMPQGGAPAPGPQASAPPAAPQPPGGQAPVASRPNPIGGNSPQGAAYGDLHNTIASMHKDSVNAVARTAQR